MHCSLVGNNETAFRGAVKLLSILKATLLTQMSLGLSYLRMVSLLGNRNTCHIRSPLKGHS